MKAVSVLRRTAQNVRHVVTRIPAIMLANLLLTRQCTQRCLQCTIPDTDSGEPFMSFDTFTRLIDRLDSHGTQFISFSGGEPLLHPELPDMIRYASKRQFLHLQLLSNFYAADAVRDRTIETLLETGTGIQISFDGFGEVADRLRGGTRVAERVEEGIRLLDRENKKRRKPIRTSINIVLSALNLHQVPELLDFVESLGWKANVDLYRWTSDNHRELDELKIRDFDALVHTLELVQRSKAVTTPPVILEGYRRYFHGGMPKRCPYLDCPSLGTKVFIDQDGEVNICLGDSIGNLVEHTPAELFTSKVWHQRIEELKRCPGCWNTCYTPTAITFHPRSLADIRAIIGTAVNE